MTSGSNCAPLLIGWIVWPAIGILVITSCVSSNTINTAAFVKDYFANRIVHQIAIFGCWDLHDILAFSRFLMNFDMMVSYIPISTGLTMEKILKVNYYRLGIFLDLDCSDSASIFEQFRNQRMRYNESYWWLIISKREAVPTHFLSEQPLNIATEMTLAIGRDAAYKLYDVYNPSYRHGAQLNVTFMGYWNICHGLTIQLTQYKYNRRRNLAGIALNSSIVIHHPTSLDLITYLNYPIERHTDSMHRFNYGLIVQLRDYYNFTMNLMRGSTWGYLLPNGTHTGIMGDLASGLVDLSVSPFRVTKSRVDVAEFTVQAWPAKVCFIFRHPQKDQLSNPFLKPFQADIWGWIVVIGFAHFIVLYVAVKVQQYDDSQESVDTLDTHSLSEISLIVIGAICQHGFSDAPRTYSGRIVFIFLFLWTMLMFQFYSASIVSSLLIEPYRYISTPQDLLDSNIEVGAEDIDYNHDFFSTSDDAVVEGLFLKKMSINEERRKESFFGATEGLQKVKQGGFAFHIDTATAYKIIEETFDENEICELQEIHVLPKIYLSTAIAKHSPFKKMVTYGMRKIMERGTPQRLRNVWHHRRPQCPESRRTSPVPVPIEDFYPAIFLLLLGLGSSLFIMFLETIFTKRKLRKSYGSIDNLQILKILNAENMNRREEES